MCCEVPLLSHHLYENEYQSVFWMIFEANTKRYIISGDAFPVIYKVMINKIFYSKMSKPCIKNNLHNSMQAH